MLNVLHVFCNIQKDCQKNELKNKGHMNFKQNIFIMILQWKKYISVN